MISQNRFINVELDDMNICRIYNGIYLDRKLARRRIKVADQSRSIKLIKYYLPIYLKFTIYFNYYKYLLFLFYFILF